MSNDDFDLEEDPDMADLAEKMLSKASFALTSDRDVNLESFVKLAGYFTSKFIVGTFKAFKEGGIDLDYTNRMYFVEHFHRFLIDQLNKEWEVEKYK